MTQHQSVTRQSQATQRILVVGGAGHVGSILRPRLEQEHEVFYFDRAAIPEAGVRSMVGDLEDEHLLRQSVRNIDSLIYLAMGVDGNGRTQAIDPAFNINVRGLYRAGDIALSEGVTNMVYASSISVFHLPIVDGPVDESTPPSARDVYGLTKYLGEQALQGLSRRYPAATLLALRLYHPQSDAGWAKIQQQDAAQRKPALAPNDTRRLFLAAAALRAPGYHLLHATGDMDGGLYPATAAKELLGWRAQGN